jgi:hypothetical protein
MLFANIHSHEMLHMGKNYGFQSFIHMTIRICNISQLKCSSQLVLITNNVSVECTSFTNVIFRVDKIIYHIHILPMVRIIN